MEADEDRIHCRAQLTVICKADQGSHPHFVNGHRTEKLFAWWQGDVVAVGCVDVVGCMGA